MYRKPYEYAQFGKFPGQALWPFALAVKGAFGWLRKK